MPTRATREERVKSMKATADGKRAYDATYDDIVKNGREAIGAEPDPTFALHPSIFDHIYIPDRSLEFSEAVEAKLLGLGLGKPMEALAVLDVEIARLESEILQADRVAAGNSILTLVDELYLTYCTHATICEAWGASGDPEWTLAL